MFTFKIGKTNVDLRLLVTILGIAFLIGLIRSVLLRKQIAQLGKNCRESRFDQAIPLAKKLKNNYQRSYRLFKVQRIRRAIETFNIYLAISYFGISNHELFLEHINLVDDSNKTKYLWLALYDLLEDNLDEARKHYDMLVADKDLETSIRFLDGIFAHKQGNYEEAKAILESVYPKLNYSLLKDIAKQYMS